MKKISANSANLDVSANPVPAAIADDVITETPVALDIDVTQELAEAKTQIAELEAQLAAIPPTFSLAEFYPTLRSMSETDFVIDNYNKAFAQFTRQAVQAGSLTKDTEMLLYFSFKRLFSVHTACVPGLTDVAEKTARIRLVEKYWRAGVATKTEYEDLFKAPKAPTGRGRGRGAVEPSVDYTPLVCELQKMHDSVQYTEAQSEEIQVIIRGLTLTETRTAEQALLFYTTLTTSENPAILVLQTYIGIALNAAASSKQTAEQKMETEILAMLAR